MCKVRNKNVATSFITTKHGYLRALYQNRTCLKKQTKNCTIIVRLDVKTAGKYDNNNSLSSIVVIVYRALFKYSCNLTLEPTVTWKALFRQLDNVVWLSKRFYIGNESSTFDWPLAWRSNCLDVYAKPALFLNRT